jgi:acetolactate synthase-1/3 small subunit
MPDIISPFALPSAAAPYPGADSRTPPALTVLELDVRNHPGAMSHITGLFARRAFNLEAIVCAPTGDGATSRMLLLVAAGSRLEQIRRQLERLHDVFSVRERGDLDADVFQRVVLATGRTASAPAAGGG